MPKNKVKYGICNVHYAKATLAENGKTITYEKPVPMPGAKSLTLSPTGEPGKFFADNILYYQSGGASGYEGEYEVALLPDEFCTDILGDAKDENGNIMEKAMAQTSCFALLFQFEGDVKAVRHCLYYCTASRPELTGETVEGTVEPGTETLSFAAGARPDNGNIKYRTTLETDKEVYDKWFDAVPEPPAGLGV